MRTLTFLAQQYEPIIARKGIHSARPNISFLYSSFRHDHLLQVAFTECFAVTATIAD